MQTSNQTRAALLDVYRRSGDDLVTVYLPSPSAVADAEQRLDIRKRNVLAELGDLDVDEQIVDRLTTELDGLDHADGVAHAFVLGADGVLLSHEMDRPLAEAVVHVGPCPLLLPLVAATQVDASHLAVLIDRTGADVLLRDGVGDALESFEVEGPDVRVHRSQPGGWSQKRFQQTAENAWENNARTVVEEVVDEHRDVDLLVCGGDVRAVGFFVEHLPEHIEVHQVDGSRQADHDAFLDEVDVALRTRAAAGIVQLIDDWQSAAGSGSGSTGLDVLDHLTQGRVEHLLVVNDARDSDRVTSVFDFDQPAHVPDGGDSGTHKVAPVTDAAVALAVATGAAVTVVPDHGAIDSGLAAILRF